MSKSYREMTKQEKRCANFPIKAHAEIVRLRRSLDNIKIRAYELGQREIHDMALHTLETDDE